MYQRTIIPNILRDREMILVTGGAGFIGGNFVLAWFAGDGEDENIIIPDKLTYARNRRWVENVINSAYHRWVGKHCGARS